MSTIRHLAITSASSMTTGFALAQGRLALAVVAAAVCGGWLWSRTSLTPVLWRRRAALWWQARRIGVCRRCFAPGPTHHTARGCRAAAGTVQVRWSNRRRRFEPVEVT